MAENSNLGAIVKDGVIQDTSASQLSLSKDKSAEKSSSLDKDAFLQLLVAQMKYQDPMEPTDNTAYISQLATFSQLEEMQNMTAGMSLQRASGLVGEEVICKVTNKSTGNTEYAQGIVDYVVYENNKAYVSVNDSLYSVDDVYQVMEKGYSEAYELARKFVSAIQSLPDTDHLTTEYDEALTVLRETFNAMSDYQKSFIDRGFVEQLEALEAKMRTLKGE